MARATDDGSGVCYFLGNITSHILHALPLWKSTGGEFVVLSRAARERLEPYGVPVRVVDDIPYAWRRTGPRFERTDQYLHVPSSARRTVAYLEEHARVVLFYELFDFGRPLRLRGPRTVFMSHGNGIKPYFTGRNRVRLANDHYAVAAPGPYGREVLAGLGVRRDVLVDLGIARTDEVLARRGPRTMTTQLRKVVGDVDGSSVFTYVPTYWGPTSVDTLGFELVAGVRDNQVLLVRLHPQTPDRIVAAYRLAASRRPHVHLLHADRQGLGLLDVLAAADAIVGDVSSVMIEALLLDKPLVFAVDDASKGMLTRDHPISRVVEKSAHLWPGTRDHAATLDAAVGAGIDSSVWEATKQQLFFHADGTSVQHIAEFVRTL